MLAYVWMGIVTQFHAAHSPPRPTSLDSPASVLVAITIRFPNQMTQYYSMSICTPARASLMTGRYPIRYGLHYNVIQPGAPWGLPLTEKVPDTYYILQQ